MEAHEVRINFSLGNDIDMNYENQCFQIIALDM